jgi:hypothetical protein
MKLKCLASLNKSDLFYLLKGKYLDDSFFKRCWVRAESGIEANQITKPSKSTFHISNDLLYRNGKVYVSDLPEVKKKILYECHDAPSVGHPGIHQTLILISTNFF